MKFHQVILYGSRVMLIFAKWFHVVHEQGDYRAHYVNRFCDLLRAVQWLGESKTVLPSSNRVCSYLQMEYQNC